MSGEKMQLLIKNGLVVDPEGKINKVCDILVDNGRISQLAGGIKSDAGEIIDASGKIVMPGIVDMHVHLREPGREDKETVASGTLAGLKGGVTSMLAMPNTQPAIDSIENIRLLKNIIGRSAQANVFICGSISRGRLGKELSDIAGLKTEGALAISDDGFSVDDQELMLKALQAARKENIAVICHCEDKSLSGGGVVNLGLTSTRLGLRGISSASEHERVKRDIHLAQKANHPVHIAHVSCKESVELISLAKKKGIPLSAETAPHYFSLSEEAAYGYDTNMKVNPPLRSKDDVSAVRQGLKDGTIDAIASDHAPHTENEKDIEFERAEFGVIGLETMLAAAVTELIDRGILDWPALVRKLTSNPARILGINKGMLKAGSQADLLVVSADRQWIVKKQGFVSQSKNCAFLGKSLRGIVEYTILAGKVAYKHTASADKSAER
jgi:dihydroorotase